MSWPVSKNLNKKKYQLENAPKRMSMSVLDLIVATSLQQSLQQKRKISLGHQTVCLKHNIDLEMQCL